MSPTSADKIAEQLAAVPELDASTIGVFAGSDGDQAVVNLDGNQLRVPALGAHWPIVGDGVRLLRVGKTYLLLGPVKQRATVGRVVTAGSPRCTVEYPPGSGVSDLMGYPTNVTPVVGDVVLIDWQGEAAGTVVAVVTAAAGQVTPVPPPPPPSGGSGRQTFTAIDSGSFQGRWWTNKVYASASNKSAFFYGSKVGDTLPNDAVIDAIAIYLTPERNSGNQPRIGTHGYQSNPGGQPVINNLMSLAKTSGWVPLPTSFGDQLKAGAQWGVGFDGAGYAIFRGTQQDGQAGALDISWHT